MSTVADGLTSAEFENFLQGDGPGSFAVAVLTDSLQEHIGARVQTVVISRDTAIKQRKHPEITAAHYRAVQEMIDLGEVRSDRDRHVVLIQQRSEWFVAVIKATQDGREVYLQSFRRSDDKNVAKLRERGKLIRRGK